MTPPNRMALLLEIVVKLCPVLGEGTVPISKAEPSVEGVLFPVKAVKSISKFKDSGIFLEPLAVLLFCLSLFFCCNSHAISAVSTMLYTVEDIIRRSR